MEVHMKGYKALNMDMSSAYGDMVYEIGKKYTITGELKMCKNGFHFCKYLEDIENYYTITESRIFEVETDGEIIEEYDKSCTESITLVRELSKEEIYQYFVDNQERILDKNWRYRKTLADQGLCLDKLINDENLYVRIEVAKQGYGLETLIHDEDPWVRVVVAEQGYRLDTLVNDENPYVRATVAEQGYGLDALVYDENSDVREKVVRQGYGLETLVHDKDWSVRTAVAKQGYGLDILVHDLSPEVRMAVANQGYGLNILANDENMFVRMIAAMQKRNLNKQRYKKCPFIGLFFHIKNIFMQTIHGII